MKNILLGFLLGLMVATAVGVWAQDSGSIYTYPGTGMSTFTLPGGGTGSIYTYPGTGLSSYQDSAGRAGSIYNYPGTGASTYSFSGNPC